MLSINENNNLCINMDHFTARQAAAIEKLFTQLKQKCEAHAFDIFGGKNIFVRTLSYHQIGKYMGVKDGFLMLKDASWVANSGRFNEALISGNLEEVEPFREGIILVGIMSIVDVCEWVHELPREVK